MGQINNRNQPAATESFISLNAILFFIFSFLGVAMVIVDFTHPYFEQGGRMLWYALLSLVGPLIYISLGNRPSPQTDRRRFWCVMIVSVAILSGLTVRQVGVRAPGHQPIGIHDGAVQAETAAQFLWQGINPYGADYGQTPFAAINPPILGGPAENVVWSHFIYPPLVFLYFVPIKLIATIFNSLGDYRILTMGAIFLLFGILYPFCKTWRERTSLAILTIGNPPIWIYALVGCNDILAAVTLVGVAILTIKRKWFLAGAVMGLAIATKQSAWAAPPLWIYWLWELNRQLQLHHRHWRSALGGLVLTVVVVFGPFIIWHPANIYHDIFTYASGLIPYSYPISGNTFQQLLVIYKLVPSPWSVLPTPLFQLLIIIPMGLLVASWLRFKPTASRWLAASFVLILSTALFSRYFNNNYISGLVILLVAAAIIQQREL